jgi:hypothetical protein
VGIGDKKYFDQFELTPPKQMEIIANFISMQTKAQVMELYTFQIMKQLICLFEKSSTMAQR